MDRSIRFYAGGVKNGVRRRANIIKIAKELFGGNTSAMINFAVNKTFGLDRETGERLPDAPLYARQPEAIFLLSDAPPELKTKKRSRGQESPGT